MPTTKDIQRALQATGYEPGPIDGAPGRMTIAALKRFQADHRLAATGIAGSETLALLIPASPPIVLPPWYAEARRKVGLQEVRDRSVLMAWLRSDKHTLGDPSKLPWCGDFVETCIALTCPGEAMVTNPYLARNWLEFGIRAPTPTVGAIMVLWRGSKTGTTDGHVGFYDRETDDAYCVLGGNTGNAVAEAWVAKDRLLGVRWPRSYPLPMTGRTLVANRAATLSTNEA